MADDLNKNITINVELETEKLTQNIASLNSAIDSLLAKQQQLSTTGQQNTAAFTALTTQLEAFQKKLQEVNTQITTGTTALNALNTAGKTLDTTLSSTASQLQKNAQAAGDGSTKLKELAQQMSAVSQSANQQKSSTDQSKNSLDGLSGSIAKSSKSAGDLHSDINQANTTLGQSTAKANQSKASFDAHKLTMDHLKKSFDEVKNVSGIFGPSLQEAAKGFNVMQSGLTLVKDGLTGVGTAIKADGFDFLLQILQLMFDAFVHSSEGSKILTGAISAIGVIINEIKGFFDSFTDGIINAFSHPIDTLNNLGKMIEQNLLNRFRAFSVILDGIIHLDFKKMANGAIQAFTGVTNATDKIGKAVTEVKKGIEKTAGQMVSAYKKGYDGAGKALDKHEKKVIASNNRQKKSYESLTGAIKGANDADCTCEAQSTAGQNNTRQRDSLPNPKQADVDVPADSSNISQPGPDFEGALKKLTNNVQKEEDKKVEIKKTALQQVEDYAKQSGAKIATDALNMLNNSIKQQADAKVAALEKDKAAELSNSSLTSAQKIAIQQRYKQQEGQIKAKAFKEEQDLSIAQAIINGAQAVTKVSAQTGVLAPLEIGVVIAETAAQVAKIASQKPPAYAKGGLHYNSDGHGGLLPGYSRTDNTNAYLRSGEGIVVSEAMQVPWARNLVSAINVGFGGRDFSIANPGRGYAVGGIFTDGGDANRYYNQPINDQKNLANSIAYQMVNNFPPVYVDVKDINNQQNILAQTINRVNL